MREMDNPRQEFFDDTENTPSCLQYKEIVHNFLKRYEGNLKIDISKRGVFESTKTLPDNKCRFANYFIGGKIIQCPYDVVNLKYQSDYNFGTRYCKQNNTCCMSKIKLPPKPPDCAVIAPRHRRDAGETLHLGGSRPAVGDRAGHP